MSATSWFEFSDISPSISVQVAPPSVDFHRPLIPSYWPSWRALPVPMYTALVPDSSLTIISPMKRYPVVEVS